VSERAFPWIAAGVILLDQATKWAVRQSLALGASVPLVPGVVRLTHVHNTGSAWSMFQGAGIWLVLVSIISLVAILRYWLGLRRRGTPIGPALLWGLALPFGGAAGNLIDRVCFGYVVDFFELPRFPVFNVADSAITIGAALLIWHFMRQDTASGVQTFGHSGAEAPAPSDPTDRSDSSEADGRTPERLKA
jgi:signal peptidase II